MSNFTHLSRLIPLTSLLLATGLMAADKANPVVDKLLADLRSEKAGVRSRAAADLARIGPEVAKAVPVLIDALDDESLAVRHEVLTALDHIGPAARQAVPKLVGILESGETRLHLPAINTLGSIGHDSVDAVPSITVYLAEKEERVSLAAALALARILPADTDELRLAVPVLVKALSSKQRLVRRDALLGLLVIGPAAVPDLAELVGNHDRDPQSAAGAAAALRMIGPPAKPALPALILALQSKHDLVLTNAADAIGAIGPSAKDALTHLQNLLAHDHPLLRTHAAHNLGQLGSVAAPAVGELTNVLRDRDSNVRREAAQALGQIGSRSKSAIPELINALSDDSQPVVLAAAHALAQIGPDAVAALVPLIKDRRMQRWAVVILSEAGPAAAPAVPGLRAALAKADDDLAQDIILTLGRVGPAARDAAPELIKIAEDEKHKLRQSAVFALGNIRAPEAIPILEEILQEGDDRSSKLPLVAAGALVLIEDAHWEDHLQLALPRLIAALTDKSDLIRREAATALRQIGPPAAAAAPALLQGLNDPNPAVCVDCLWALTAIASSDAAPALAPEIVRLLSSPVPQLRYTACYAAGSLGAASIDAVPILEKNLQSSDQHLMIASAWALARIKPVRPEIAEECVDPLIRGLTVSDPQVRAEAVATLALLGPAAQRATPALTELSHDPDESLRKAAAAAVQAIRGDDQSKSTNKEKRQPTRRD